MKVIWHIVRETQAKERKQIQDSKQKKSSITVIKISRSYSGVRNNVC